MEAHYIPVDISLAKARTIITPVGIAHGTRQVGVEVGVNHLPIFGTRITVAISCPSGGHIAVLDLAQLACLQDALDHAASQLTIALSDTSGGAS